MMMRILIPRRPPCVKLPAPALCVLVVCFLVIVFSNRQAGAAVDRPNILFLLADDQRADSIAAYGNPVIQTTNIDSLIRDGFSFSRAYCMGSLGGAVCVPSRAMINTGRTLFRVPANMEGVPVLAEILQNAGYVTFGTGKWHNGTDSFVRGFQRGNAVFFGGMSDHTRVPLVDISRTGNVVDKRTGDSFSNTLFVDAAIDFLKTHDKTSPFYAYVAFTAPHDPRQAPEGYIDMYDPSEMPLPENYLPQHPFDNGWMVGRDENLAGWPRTEEVVRNQLSEYYGLITHLDYEIGRLLTALRESGNAENTYIIYAADHGLALGSHGLLGKQSLYEHSMRAPLVVVGPGVPAGESHDAFAYLMDIFPTICELAGAEEPQGVDGKSLAPIWRGEKVKLRDYVFTAFGNVMRAVRDDRWKLIRYPRINETQLFDLQNDPHELDDLAEDSVHAERVEKMLDLLSKLQNAVGDQQPLSSEDPLPAEIDLTGHPREPDQHQPDWIVKKYFGNGT